MIQITNKKKHKSTLISIIGSIIQFFDGANLFFIVAMLFAMSIVFFPFFYIAPGLLLYLLLFLLFSMSCKKNNKLAQIISLVAIATLYMITVTFYSLFRTHLFYLIIITSTMIAIRYAISKREGIKTYLWFLTPIFATVVQAITLTDIILYYMDMYKMNGYYPSIMYYKWDEYGSKGEIIFITTSLITNFVVLVCNRWWLWLFLTIATLSMAAYSTYFFWYSEFFVRKVPTVVVSIYTGGIVITLLIKLLLAKSKSQILKE